MLLDINRFLNLSLIYQKYKNMAVENPFEYLGFIHSQGLNLVITDSNFPALNIGDVFKITDRLVRDEIDSTTYLSISDVKRIIYLLGYSCDYSELPQELLAEGLITTDMVPYFQEFISAVQSSFDLYKIQSNLNDFETTISASSLTDNQKAIFFGACAIGRHSLFYWQNQLDNAKSLWQPLLKRGNVGNNGIPSKCKNPCNQWLIHIFCVDAIGAGIGGAITLGNPVGMAIGGIIASAFWGPPPNS
jgi:hypothetical protein